MKTAVDTGVLKKELSLLDTFCIATGAMISSGLFVLPAIGFAKAGPAVCLAYLLASLLVIPGLLSKCELATAMPQSGGAYFFMERSLGAAAGTFGGVINWLSLCFKSAFALVGIGVFATLLYPELIDWQVKVVAAGCCLFFVLINCFSVKHTGNFQTGLVLTLVGILLLYIVRGFPQVDTARYTPLMPFGVQSVLETAGLVFVSFGGLTKVASLASEIRNPGRTIPQGMIIAFLVTMALYVLTVFVTVGVVQAGALSASLTPLSLAAEHIAGTPGVWLLSLAGMLAFVTTGNAGILSASRFPMAMSHDGLVPEVIGKVSYRFCTPIVSILLTGSFMMAIIFFFELEDLVKTASTLKLLLFIFVNVAVIIMRESRLVTYRPTFRAPLYPWLQIFGVVTSAVLIFEMGFVALEWSAIFLAGSLTWYLVYGRTRVQRQSALMHVVKRITSRELAGATLDSELKGIVIERDNIVEDRFDHLIQQCKIIDYEGPATAREVLTVASQHLADRFHVGQQALLEDFLQREEESSTVVATGLAIPHVVVEGTGRFAIMIIRCRQGITFPHTSEPVHTLFVLAGSLDERNFHLRALAAIAQIAQDKDFEEHWLRIKRVEQLRNLILIAERKRIGVL